ncbi:hypothetical protein F5Y10DRAFT_251976 [Nemania abortiva]|nr:hypothetical protein F5Y10DRAFT_251976 [Nemania abortiva]
MEHGLEALPVELVCHIAASLDLQHIRCLRLTSRSLAAKLAPRNFARFFASKRIELALEPLRNMAYMTSKGHMSSLLQHCTIVGIAENDDNYTPNLDELVRLLTEAFINIKKHSPRAGIASLRLGMAVRIIPDDGPDDAVDDEGYWVPKPCPRRARQVFEWDAALQTFHTYWVPKPCPRRAQQVIVWDAALKTFDITMKALHGSQLPVLKHLDLFDDVPQCSLVYKALLPLGQQLASTAVFSSLRKLTMSASSPSFSEDQKQLARDSEEFDQSLHGTLFLQGLLAMAAFMPGLEDLDVHWYNVGGNDPKSVLEDRRVRLDTSSYVNLPRLRTCRFRGLYVHKDDLLECIKVFQPIVLTITDIHLVSAARASEWAWIPIFDYLVSADSPVTSYYLDDVYEGRRLLHFEAPGKAKFRNIEEDMGPSTLTREGDEVKEAIRYRTTFTRAIESGAYTSWWWDKSVVFGPPSF